MTEAGDSGGAVGARRAGLRRIGPNPALLARELAHRSARSLRRALLRRRYRPLVAERRGSAGLKAPPLGLPAAGALPDELRPAAELVRETAAAAAEHRVELLGWGELELGAEIAWTADPLSGQPWPDGPYQRIDLGRAERGPDVKAVWELNRCHHFLALARAVALDRDGAGLGLGAALARQWAGWLDANPPGRGVNWAMPMEVAVRAVNWIWALRTLPDRSALGPGLEARILASLRAHIAHVRWELEGSPSLRGNHHLADVTALAAGAVALDDRRGPRFPRRAIERACREQLLDDGFCFEAATGYHQLALELLLVADALAELAGAPLAAAARSRIAAAARASLALRGPGGRVAAFGDSDDSRLLPLSGRRDRSHDPALWLAAARLGTPRPPATGPHSSAPPAGVAAAEVAFSLGIEAWERATAAPEAPAPASAALADAGLYVLAAGPSHLCLRCGPVGQNGRGGHAHNDALSFELTLAGVPLIVDPGTCTYTADLSLRNHFRSTAAHNTIQLGEEEINPLRESLPFLLEDRARPRVAAFEPGPPARLRAFHDGFGGVRAEREVTVGASGEVRIEDSLSGDGRTAAPTTAAPMRARLQLAPGTAVERTGPGALRLLREGAAAELNFATGTPDAEGSEPVEPRIREGRVSELYGASTAAPLLELETGRSRLSTLIRPAGELA